MWMRLELNRRDWLIESVHAPEIDRSRSEEDKVNFWYELTTVLGKRDFYRDMTDEEKKQRKF